ncbi:PREDICTED: ankyrin repeat domain-containing protein 26-like, partial [Merops nubicus]|uniref:ankyrin repeat domain-containing protein 26-like n=1 Tax=Merops nubicus TaxID=57421 RepID=UPI0004F083C0
ESDIKREKDLLYKNQLLQDEIAMLRLELDQVRLRHQEEGGKYLEENKTLKEINEYLRKELKLNKEALKQTVLQHDRQLNLLKTESAVLTSELEQSKGSWDRLETEIESIHSRLNTTNQELERHQLSKNDVERTFQRERDEWLLSQDKLHHDLSDVRESNKSLSKQLSKAESKANNLKNELHQLKQALREKTLLLETTQKELSQAKCQAKECERARQLEKDQVSKFIIKQEFMQKRLARLQSENLLLHQHLEDVQNKGIIQEKVVNDVQEWFNDIFNKLRAITEKQVCLVEEKNKELNAKCTDLIEQVSKYEAEKVEREGKVRELQQKLADALKKQSVSEASLEDTKYYLRDLEEDKLCLQMGLQEVKSKVGELCQQLESKKCMQLEVEKQALQKELSTMHGNHEKLKMTKWQLEEEVASLRHHLETNMVDRSLMEQYKRKMEEEAEQEAQAASRDRIEQKRASHDASLRSQLERRIRDLERELDRKKSTLQDILSIKQRMQVQLERYKELFLQEVTNRRFLANNLE